MKPQITGIHHVAIKAKGEAAFARLVSFYHDVLALPILREWDLADGGKGAMIDTGAGILELFSNAPDERDAGALRHLALAVADVDVCIEAVRAAGYVVTMEPTVICIPSSPAFPARIAFCIGPVGEEVEFFCEK